MWVLSRMTYRCRVRMVRENGAGNKVRAWLQLRFKGRTLLVAVGEEKTKKVAMGHVT